MALRAAERRRARGRDQRAATAGGQKGIKGFFFKLFQKKADGGVPSANRITLLRDADGDGVAETRSAFLTGLNSPFGMALAGPDYALGPHTASLGLAWSGGTSLPDAFSQGMFVGQHGSWNRKPRSGYKVIFVPFSGGKPSGEPIDVLTGFVKENGDAMGRPVGVTLDKRGALLVADDVGNVIWWVTSAAGPG